MTAVVQPLCDCELPGPFSCGVPGVLAWLENGRVAPDARVERCDECERFASDEDARAKLVELGLADTASAGDLQTYNVHCLAVVRVTLRGISAESHRQAADLARERFDWQRDQLAAEFTGDFVQFVVGAGGPGECHEPQEFDGRSP
jgi:hypothetical protein